MQITEAQLDKIMSAGVHRIPAFLPYLNKYMPIYGINTPARVAAFLAQVAHESAEFLYTEEIASGQAYEGRKDLGNVHEGDGVKYKGRGLIQITGLSNYQAVSKALGADFVTTPKLLQEPEWAVASACWWWCKHGLNELADSGEFQLITRRVNGGLNGYESRLTYWYKAKIVFNVH